MHKTACGEFHSSFPRPSLRFMRRFMVTRSGFMLLTCLVIPLVADEPRSVSGGFPTSPGQSEAAEALPAKGIYPQGRQLCFAGYSGKPERDLVNGFTVAGPAYGNRQAHLEQCFANGWPVIAHVGVGGSFDDADPAKYKVDEPALRREIQEQVKALADHKEIKWWALRPEELRYWRKDEMKYLSLVAETIRQSDPLRRPILHYNPNNRQSKSLIPIAQHVDVVTKGCYVNYSGRKRDRAWVRWSVEQEVDAVRAVGRPGMIPIVMPELFRDPEPGEDAEIRSWVRHDVYLGLASGAKGVLVWSLFKRKEVKRTWQLWYDAYAECGRELNGERGLAQVFLFGQPSSDLVVQRVKGEAMAKVTLGGAVEATTTSAEESAQQKVEVPSWTAVEYIFGGDHWLFLVNSSNSPAIFTVAGWAKDSRAANAFDGSPVILGVAGPLSVELPAYGVSALRFGK